MEVLHDARAHSDQEMLCLPGADRRGDADVGEHLRGGLLDRRRFLCSHAARHAGTGQVPELQGAAVAGRTGSGCR